MVKYIKKGMSADKAQEADARVRGAVEGVLKDVAQRGDAAVRELSERFDQWSPPSFRLSPAHMSVLTAKVAGVPRVAACFWPNTAQDPPPVSQAPGSPCQQFT
jgi:histidinol dehydrogenase